MLHKIDWLSFSVLITPAEDATEKDAFYAAAAAIHDLHQDIPEYLSLDAEWEPRNGRAPYRTSWHRPDEGVTIFTHPSLTHSLVEVSGRGCDAVQARGYMDALLAAVETRLTRIDIACDILTDVRPLAFSEQRNVKRFKAHSYVNSESGETYYVGARSSARYARVYRYNPPHERSHFLRVEHVIKAEDAKILARTIQAEGLASVVASLGQSFGWEHPEWRLDATPAELAAYRPDRREGKTLYWLADTVAPLLARLHNEGVIDLEAWVAEHVKPKVKT